MYFQRLRNYVLVQLWFTYAVLLRLKAKTHLRTNLNVQERFIVCPMAVNEGSYNGAVQPAEYSNASSLAPPWEWGLNDQ